MSIVFLIGNGFDISCGLKTKYKNVYDSYCKENSHDSDLIRKFKKDISSDYENWSDFEEGMAIYAKELKNENEFVECINHFRDYLQIYLKQEELKFIEYINNNETLRPMIVKVMQDSIRNYYTYNTPLISNTIKSIYNNHGVSINFISFNYTNTLDKLLKDSSETNYVSHLHGKLDEYLIMGMDNESQISANYKLSERGKMAFIKPFFNNLYDTRTNRTIKEQIESAHIICVFGLSLGASDLTWRNAILNSIRNYADHHLFLFDYELSCKNTLLLNNKLDIELSKKIKLLQSWGIENLENIINKIHIPCGHKLFDIAGTIKEFEKNHAE